MNNQKKKIKSRANIDYFSSFRYWTVLILFVVGLKPGVIEGFVHPTMNGGVINNHVL